MERREFLASISGLTANYVAAPFVLADDRSAYPTAVPTRRSGDVVDSDALSQSHLASLEETPFSVSIRSTLRRVGANGRQVSKAVTREITDVGADVEFATQYRVNGDLPVRSLLYAGLLGDESIDRYTCSDTRYVRNHAENDSRVLSSNPDLQRDIRDDYTGWKDIRGLFRGANWLTTQERGAAIRWLGYEKSLSSPRAGFRPARIVGAVRPSGRFESFRARFRRRIPDSKDERVDRDILTCVVEFDDVGTAEVSKPGWCADASKPDWW